MSSETPIKPGDVVRWRQRDLTVACVISEHLYWCGWPPGSIPVSRVMLVESCSPERERRTIEECARLQERNDPRRNWARAEALARGWRELDREDVREEPRLLDIWVGDARIGEVAKHGDTWSWMHHPSGYATGSGSVDEAIAAVLAAENARRAQEGK